MDADPVPDEQRAEDEAWFAYDAALTNEVTSGDPEAWINEVWDARARVVAAIEHQQYQDLDHHLRLAQNDLAVSLTLERQGVAALMLKQKRIDELQEIVEASNTRIDRMRGPYESPEAFISWLNEALLVQTAATREARARIKALVYALAAEQRAQDVQAEYYQQCDLGKKPGMGWPKLDFSDVSGTRDNANNLRRAVLLPAAMTPADWNAATERMRQLSVMLPAAPEPVSAPKESHDAAD